MTFFSLFTCCMLFLAITADSETEKHQAMIGLIVCLAAATIHHKLDKLIKDKK